jgi:alkanesulfonate monooxygenase SsuD/methylene tetrahydromethanopterin reductase-like flavin-dependent oxidoreductase (luciferase family)
MAGKSAARWCAIRCLPFAEAGRLTAKNSPADDFHQPGCGRPRPRVSGSTRPSYARWWQNSPPDHPRWKISQRLTEITLEETLRGSVFIGSPDTVVGKLKDLQRDIGLSGVQLETNCAGLADHAAEREAIRLLAREVKSAFR